MYSIIHVIITDGTQCSCSFFSFYSMQISIPQRSVHASIHPLLPLSHPPSIHALKGTITKLYAAASCKFCMIKWCLWVAVKAQKVRFKCQETHHLAQHCSLSTHHDTSQQQRLKTLVSLQNKKVLSRISYVILLVDFLLDICCNRGGSEIGE